MCDELMIAVNVTFGFNNALLTFNKQPQLRCSKNMTTLSKPLTKIQ